MPTKSSSVPDERMDWLTELYQPKRPSTPRWTASTCRGCPYGRPRAAARRQLNQCRTADMFVLVVRAFDNPSVPAYRNRVDPRRDLEELCTELLLADLELVTTRIERLEKQAHKPSKTQARDKMELALQLKLQEAIEAENPSAASSRRKRSGNGDRPHPELSDAQAHDGRRQRRRGPTRQDLRFRPDRRGHGRCPPVRHWKANWPNWIPKAERSL